MISSTTIGYSGIAALYFVVSGYIVLIVAIQFGKKEASTARLERVFGRKQLGHFNAPFSEGIPQSLMTNLKTIVFL